MKKLQRIQVISAKESGVIFSKKKKRKKKEIPLSIPKRAEKYGVQIKKTKFHSTFLIRSEFG